MPKLNQPNAGGRYFMVDDERLSEAEFNARQQAEQQADQQDQPKSGNRGKQTNTTDKESDHA